MKKIFLLSITLCLAHVCFAQLKVNNVGNAAIGATPNTGAKLLLDNQSTVNSTLYGLYSTVKNTNGGSPLYGAYFKNIHSGVSTNSGSTYGIYSENNNTTYGGGIYSFYAKNTTSNYAGTIYGSYIDNAMRATCGSVVGYYVKNTKAFSSSVCGDLYGVQVANLDSSISSVYGIHINNVKINTSGYSYGVYSAVSGGNTLFNYSGYFTGGKFVVMNGSVGIGKDPASGRALDVNGGVWANNVQLTSDERLKSDIKPLIEEKEKLYLLQGKSYKKGLLPIGFEEDSLSLTTKTKQEENIEFFEYGYLAQELKEVFPDLVSQDSSGYYAVNYIGLIPVIIEALKDQRLENEKQQTQIEEQREQIKQLVKLIGIKSIDEKAFEENGIESIPLLLQNTPNPFNQATEIGYFIPETVKSANIYIYDMNGFQQKNISITERGKGVTVLQATALQAGMYFYTLICDGKPVDTKQMILTR